LSSYSISDLIFSTKLEEYPQHIDDYAQDAAGQNISPRQGAKNENKCIHLREAFINLIQASNALLLIFLYLSLGHKLYIYIPVIILTLSHPNFLQFSPKSFIS
jgi:hypothetical protein